MIPDYCPVYYIFGHSVGFRELLRGGVPLTLDHVLLPPHALPPASATHISRLPHLHFRGLAGYTAAIVTLRARFGVDVYSLKRALTLVTLY